MLTNSPRTVKVAPAAIDVVVGDTLGNAKKTIDIIRRAAEDGARLVCFGKLSLVGCTSGDLLYQEIYLQGAMEALKNVVDSIQTDVIYCVGLPMRIDGTVYPCTAVCRGKKILGIVASGLKGRFAIDLFGQRLTLGDDNYFDEVSGTRFAIWPKRSDITLYPGSEPLFVGSEQKLKWELSLLTKQGGAIVYASAPWSESTTDFVYSGQLVAAQNSQIVGEKKFARGQYAVFELKVSEFLSGLGDYSQSNWNLLPDSFILTHEGCEQAARIQASGLSVRLERSGLKKLVVGLSGGLDSTLALLVCVNTASMLALPLENIIAVTMPGFGTSQRTLANVGKLCGGLGVKLRTIDITDSCTRHLESLDHDLRPDTAYENAQARERTQILMDLANMEDALVVGTGDLSEAALGWCTYGGDHLSMYNVNAGIPKTGVRKLVAYHVQKYPHLADVLKDIAETPISPELLPGGQQGEIAQSTEETIGSFDVHDFILFETLRHGHSPKKIWELACVRFNSMNRADMRYAFEKFYQRFLSSQFKRSCSPDGPCVFGVSLSPRQGMRMPSDASNLLWKQQLDEIFK
ncbi:MAG: NAD(+) synthase [Christensenellales bacterium]